MKMRKWGLGLLAVFVVGAVAVSLLQRSGKVDLKQWLPKGGNTTNAKQAETTGNKDFAPETDLEEFLANLHWYKAAGHEDFEVNIEYDPAHFVLTKKYLEEPVIAPMASSTMLTELTDASNKALNWPKSPAKGKIKVKEIEKVRFFLSANGERFVGCDVYCTAEKDGKLIHPADKVAIAIVTFHKANWGKKRSNEWAAKLQRALAADPDLGPSLRGQTLKSQVLLIRQQFRIANR